MSEAERRVMLIAGGTGSIGAVIAAQALDAGWRVAVHGRSAASAEAAVGRIGKGRSAAGRLHGFAADMLLPGAIEQLVADAAAWGGRLDAVIDCIAGGPALRVTGAFADTDPAGFAPFLEHSIANLQRLTHAALPWLARQGGTLVAFASDAGRFAAPRQTVVGASRGAIMAFVRNLAVEVARDGVRVHCVSPSFVDGTESARRLAERNGERMAKARARAGLGLPTPEDIAPVVLFLCGDGARRITGQVISINGGLNA